MQKSIKRSYLKNNFEAVKLEIYFCDEKTVLEDSPNCELVTRGLTYLLYIVSVTPLGGISAGDTRWRRSVLPANVKACTRSMTLGKNGWHQCGTCQQMQVGTWERRLEDATWHPDGEWPRHDTKLTRGGKGSWAGTVAGRLSGWRQLPGCLWPTWTVKCHADKAHTWALFCRLR